MAQGGACNMVTLRFEPLAYLLKTGLIELAKDFSALLEPDEVHCPDWEKYQVMEKKDALRFVAMRKGDKLIGFSALTIEDDLHHKDHKMAILHDIFVVETGHAPTLMRFIEKHMWNMKVTEIIGASRMNYARTGKFFEVMGYHAKEVIWSKKVEALN